MDSKQKKYSKPLIQNINHVDLGNRISVAENPGDIWIRVDTVGMPPDTKVAVFFSTQWGSHDHTIGEDNPGYVDTRIEHRRFENQIGSTVIAHYQVKLPSDPDSIKSEDTVANVVK
ncbi:hypothetical protein [Pseudomonas sp. CLCA07]